MAMEAQKHHTQKSTGALADRHARVLLAKDSAELERAYDEWAKEYDADASRAQELMAMEAQKHHTQKSTGALADRHARVLLAKDSAELERAYDEWAKEYDADLVAISGGGENTSALAACRVLVQHIDVKDRDMRMLDFGCGTGSAGLFLHQHGMDTLKQLDGCDLSAGMLAKAAERKLYRKLIKADFATSNCTPDSYDVLHCSAVFAPGQAPPSTLDEFYALLKLDGRAVFTVRCEYYDSEEGAEHKTRLETMLREGKWTLIEKSKQAYLPNDGVLAYVFVLRKR